MRFENILNFEMKFDDQIFSKKEINKVESLSVKLFQLSLLKFTYKPISRTSALIIFLNYTISSNEEPAFKKLKLDDVKNIIYNRIIDNQIQKSY